ncbi:hypothetical protein CHH61_03310 [Shouchella clausii]|uniref:Uncharacterized protein n=1 Tax=Shouchella clausii TaxID=79880 RepID=A0A268S4T8_SHOCL|nr:hypothetical protein [Shouchella clausii]PAF27437.1 hypothetical protein CHH61_03310 [Shouchella clausii]
MNYKDFSFDIRVTNIQVGDAVYQLTDTPPNNERIKNTIARDRETGEIFALGMNYYKCEKTNWLKEKISLLQPHKEDWVPGDKYVFLVSALEDSNRTLDFYEKLELPKIGVNYMYKPIDGPILSCQVVDYEFALCAYSGLVICPLVRLIKKGNLVEDAKLELHFPDKLKELDYLTREMIGAICPEKEQTGVYLRDNPNLIKEVKELRTEAINVTYKKQACSDAFGVTKKSRVAAIATTNTVHYQVGDVLQVDKFQFGYEGHQVPGIDLFKFVVGFTVKGKGNLEVCNPYHFTFVSTD